MTAIAKRIETVILNISALDPSITRVLRQRGLDHRAMSQMTAVELFDEYCGFYGILKAGDEFASVLDGARAHEAVNPVAPKAAAVFADHCAKRNVRGMAHSLAQVLDNIRSCHHLADEPLKHAA